MTLRATNKGERPRDSYDRKVGRLCGLRRGRSEQCECPTHVVFVNTVRQSLIWEATGDHQAHRLLLHRWVDHKGRVEIKIAVVHEVALRSHLRLSNQAIGIDPLLEPDGKTAPVLEEPNYRQFHSID